MEVIWPAPDGTQHLTVTLPATVEGCTMGGCSTCGLVHNVGHAVTAARFPKPSVCVTEVIDWPYECGAKDKHPDHMVYRCVPHGIWWHEPGMPPDLRELAALNPTHTVGQLRRLAALDQIMDEDDLANGIPLS